DAGACEFAVDPVVEFGVGDGDFVGAPAQSVAGGPVRSGGAVFEGGAQVGGHGHAGAFLGGEFDAEGHVVADGGVGCPGRAGLILDPVGVVVGGLVRADEEFAGSGGEVGAGDGPEQSEFGPWGGAGLVAE